jgi:hypothetical protein
LQVNIDQPLLMARATGQMLAVVSPPTKGLPPSSTIDWNCAMLTFPSAPASRWNLLCNLAMSSFVSLPPTEWDVLFPIL